MYKLLSVFCLSVLMVFMCRADTWYVATNGNDSAVGTSWDAALQTIGRGVAKAQSGDTVLVSNGVYVVAQQIHVSKEIVLTGFLGRAQTIIDGDRATRCLFIDHPRALVNGFTISNGVAGTALRGGGVYIGEAGGVLHDCLVIDNIARNGGGVSVENDFGQVKNCCIKMNTTVDEYVHDGGGGAYLRYGGSLTGCEIISNSAVAGGGIRIESDGYVSNCMVHANSSDFTSTWTGGGGIFINNAGTVVNCTITENKTIKYGAGIYCYYGTAAPDVTRIENCIVVSNRITGSEKWLFGGGIHFRGEAVNVSVRNCLLAYNFAYGGGGVYLNSKSNQLVNCTIVNNTASSSTGGAQVGGADQLLNCIVYNNTAPSKPNLACSGEGLTGGVKYSCSFPVADMGDGTGNITDPPLFEAGGTFRLQSGSPCINTGTNLEWMADARDLDGRRRLDPFSRKVDMGAYEFLPKGTLFMIR